MPVITPALGAASSYMPCAASGDSSRKGVPGSSSICTRSRGSSLPRAVCLARAASPPPSGMPRDLGLQVGHQRAHGLRIGLELGGTGVELGLQNGHVSLAWEAAACPAETTPAGGRLAAG